MSDLSSRPDAHRRTRLSTLLAAVFLAVLAPRAYAQFRIAVVDIRRAVAESSEGRSAAQVIKVRFDQRQGDLNHRGEQIERLKRRIESRRDPMATLQKLAQRYQRDVTEYQQLSQRYTTEIQQMEAELTKRILVKMQPIVREVGQTENYQLIVDEQVVLFAPSHLNLTDRVVQLYNQRFPAVVPPPTAADAGPPRADASAPAPPPDGGARPVAPLPPTSPDAGRTGGLPGVFFRRDAGH